ncbi:uncharacterized protein LOC118169841 [Oxyura jamaicensis]|uniref:uncharacterized protein LOC118169841 n=1 Tax=Oxyura jamaicensis TaxID=8884 RepID=UPI0015A5E437|nr:uncharacterized protein LOC118169841 [Oxyura jamaicensis]
MKPQFGKYNNEETFLLGHKEQKAISTTCKSQKIGAVLTLLDELQLIRSSQKKLLALFSSVLVSSTVLLSLVPQSKHWLGYGDQDSTRTWTTPVGNGRRHRLAGVLGERLLPCNATASSSSSKVKYIVSVSPLFRALQRNAQVCVCSLLCLAASRTLCPAPSGALPSCSSACSLPRLLPLKKDRALGACTNTKPAMNLQHHQKTNCISGFNS